MAQIVVGGCLSHSPLANLAAPVEHQAGIARYQQAAAQLGAAIRKARADIVVLFAPAHSAEASESIPTFRIATCHVAGLGDWGTPVGPFRVATNLAKHIADGLLGDDFDPAISPWMTVDHGVTQPLRLCGLEEMTILPILINATVRPLSPPARAYRFGAAVARAIAGWDMDARVAILGSGGLSHSPPPSVAVEEKDQHAAAAPSRGQEDGVATASSREAYVVANYERLAVGISPSWDRFLLDRLQRGETADLAEILTTASIDTEGGSGGQEIRAWLATAAALGDPPFEILSYEPIPFLITGTGVVLARHSRFDDGQAFNQ